MSRLARLASRVAAVASSSSRSAVLSGEASQVTQCLAAYSASKPSWYHTSSSLWATTTPTGTAPDSVKVKDEKFGYLVDKDVWDEAWAYEPRFGTVDNPIEVPALLNERIIGVTDPEDDTLVIWGVIKEGEPPKQLVAGGEFFVLKKVERIERVADKLGISH